MVDHSVTSMLCDHCKFVIWKDLAYWHCKGLEYVLITTPFKQCLPMWFCLALFWLDGSDLDTRCTSLYRPPLLPRPRSDPLGASPRCCHASSLVPPLAVVVRPPSHLPQPLLCVLPSPPRCGVLLATPASWSSASRVPFYGVRGVEPTWGHARRAGVPGARCVSRDTAAPGGRDPLIPSKVIVYLSNWAHFFASFISFSTIFWDLWHENVIWF